MQEERQGQDCSGSGQGYVAFCCDCGNELSLFIKCGKFLDQLRTCQLLKDSAAWSQFSWFVLRWSFHQEWRNQRNKKPYGTLTGVEDRAPRFFSPKIHPCIQLPRHPIVLKEQWGKRRSLFFVSELLFRYVAV